MRQVFLFGNDISNRVISIPEVTVTAGDFGQLAINDLPSIVGNNIGRFWDQTNEASPFFGATDLSVFTIDIYNDGQIVYEGTLQGIQCDNKAKTANITLKSTIQRNLEKGLKYASTDNANPATIVQQICSLYKINIDAGSFGQASAIYNLDNVRVSAFFKAEGTVFDGIQQVLEVGIGRVYLENNRLYYDVFENRTVSSVFTASDKSDNPDGITLIEHPNITTIEKEPVSGYSIKHINGEVVYGDSDNQGKSIDGTNSSPVRIMNANSGVWIGEKWLEYFSKPQQIINFSIPTRFGKSIKINYPLNIEYRDGTYLIDVISLNNSLVLESKIGGITR